MTTRAAKIAEAERQGLSFPFPDPPEPGGTIEVAPGVLWGRLPLPMALDHVNVYLLEDGDGWALVDTGMATDPCREAWGRLLEGRRISRVIVTHHHPDHVGLAGWLCERDGAPLLMTRTAFLYARMLQLDAWDVLPDEAEAFYARAGFDDEQMQRARDRAKFGFSKVCGPLPLGFHRLEEGDALRIGDRRWTVWRGDGHAPEHALLVSDDGLVLAGDQILPRITSNIGVYPTEPEGDPLGEWMAACARLAETLPEGLLALPGHNEPFRGVAQRLRALHAHHEATLERLEGFLDRPRTAVECFPQLFDRAISPPLLGFATVEAIAHLNRLVRQGAAVRRRQGEAYTYQRPERED